MSDTTKRYDPSKYQAICRVSEIEARLALVRHKRFWIVAGAVYAVTLLLFMVWAINHW